MPSDTLPKSGLASATPRQDVLFTDLDGVAGVLVDLHTKKYYQLNETASFVWRGLEKRMSVEEIAREMTNAYDVSLQHARASVAGLLGALSAEALLQPPH